MQGRAGRARLRGNHSKYSVLYQIAGRARLSFRTVTSYHGVFAKHRFFRRFGLERDFGAVLGALLGQNGGQLAGCSGYVEGMLALRRGQVRV